MKARKHNQKITLHHATLTDQISSKALFLKMARHVCGKGSIQGAKQRKDSKQRMWNLPFKK